MRKPAEGFSPDSIRLGVPALTFIEREASLLACLHGGGMEVQRPLEALVGGYVHTMDGAPATLYRWLEGEALDKVAHTRELGERVGRMTARMHRLLRNCDISTARGGCQYTQQRLPTLEARVCDAHRAGAYGEEQAGALKAALDAIGARMDELDARLGAPQAVHADLSPGNMLLTAEGIAPIDFSLSGVSHIHMDIAGLLAGITDNEARQGVLDGYARESGVETELHDVEPYFALQIMLFICCQYERFIHEDWFSKALIRWTKETFAPLARGERFLSVGQRQGG